MLQLVLRDNDLVELPPELGELADLNELHLQNNRLTALPPSLGMYYVIFKTRASQLKACFLFSTLESNLNNRGLQS